MRDGSFYDLLIAGMSAVTLIFIIMLIITRSVVAAAVIVGTVLLSLGASFGLSVLALAAHPRPPNCTGWCCAMSVILLLAVGSDYNLLLVSRFKEELPRRAEDRHHPRDGGHRVGGDVGGSGVRGHDGVVRVQRPEGHGAGRHARSRWVCCSTP